MRGASPGGMEDNEDDEMPRAALGQNGVPFVCFRPDARFRRTDAATARYVDECWCSYCGTHMTTHRNWSRHLERCHYPRPGAGTPGCMDAFLRAADQPSPVLAVPREDLPGISLGTTRQKVEQKLDLSEARIGWANMMVKTGVALTATEGPIPRRALAMMGASSDIPRGRRGRSADVDLVARFTQRAILADCREGIVSLITDICTIDGRCFAPWILAATGGSGRTLRLFDIVELDSATGTALAASAMGVADRLAHVGARIVSVTTDGAANMRRFGQLVGDPAAAFPEMDVILLGILHLRCRLHLVALAERDLLGELDGGPQFQAAARALSDAVRARAFRRLAKANSVRKAPMLQDGTWGTYGQLVTWHASSRDTVEALLTQLKHHDIVEALNSLDWAHWGAVATEFSRFMAIVQADSAGLATSFPAERELRSRMLGLCAEGNPIAESAVQMIEKRMAEGGSDILALAAFSVTSDGMPEVTEWLQADMNIYAPSAHRRMLLANRQLALHILEEIARVVTFLHPESGRVPGGCEALVRRFFQRPPHDMPAFAVWGDDQRHWRLWYATWADANDPRQYVAHAALVLLSVPCHEAAAERLFSTLEWLFDPRRRRASPGLLRNEMIVRMWQVYTGEPAGLPFYDVL